MKKTTTQKVKYSLTKKGAFVIENYNQSKPFCNFFPGIAGLWGIPMWAFYVNRGQCIASFGIEAKDKAIMEFQPANKSYRQTSLNGFRTFIKVKTGSTEKYWEPFQTYLKGTDYKKKVKMSITAHDLTLEEVNEDLGLTVTVNYFTLPQEPYAALVRRVTVKNNQKKNREIEIIDGLPNIVPFGLSDWLNKNMSRTVEAWVKVKNLENKAPFYQLNVEVSDTPQVKHIKEGNFYFSFDPSDKMRNLNSPIVEATQVFGQACDFIAPEKFLDGTFKVDAKQKTSNKSPSALSYSKKTLKASGKTEIISLFGYACNQYQLNGVVEQAKSKAFIDGKSKENEVIVKDVKDYAFTNSSSDAFNQYSGHTFLDNILRGGLPVSIKTSEGNIAFNVYSRKHGDLERDYNYFFVSPTYYSQGNGNYRDVNQNRRNDVWFNKDVKTSHLVGFLNLSQADGYNPLVVKGTSFHISDEDKFLEVLNRCVDKGDHAKIKEFVSGDFLPGELLSFVEHNSVTLDTDIKDFLGQVLEICSKKELAEHGEGFWSDHWHYNLDLVESYLGLYPESLRALLLEEKDFSFYHNDHYVLPRDKRYVLTAQGVRQYESVKHAKDEISVEETGNKLRSLNGEGAEYKTNLICKLLCLIANKVASLDPSNVGVEMEADKPNWYDALNGLPGLIGSSISETMEVKRFAQFALDSLQKLDLEDSQEVLIFKELATFISGLINILTTEEDPLSYWIKSNDIKERYRQRIRLGIEGEETSLTVSDVKNFLSLVVAKTEKSFELGQNSNGRLSTYFYHDVTDHDVIDKSQNEQTPLVMPKAFERHDLPLFLEGYVHALRGESSISKSRKLYNQVRESGLFDKKLKMYRVNDDLSNETEEIGRTRIFPTSWLENGSIWLHMEYKFILELLRCELYEEFYENFKSALVPFLKPEMYGRNVLENSSFIVSSTHEDENLHGQGFVARLSGSTAEFIHMWIYMNAGKNPFVLNQKNELVLNLKPALTGWLFTKKKQTVDYVFTDGNVQKINLPENTYAFKFLGSTLVVYHNPKRLDTFGKNKPGIKKIELMYCNQKKPVVVTSGSIVGQSARDVRDGKVSRIDVYFASK